VDRPPTRLIRSDSGRRLHQPVSHSRGVQPGLRRHGGWRDPGGGDPYETRAVCGASCDSTGGPVFIEVSTASWRSAPSGNLSRDGLGGREFRGDAAQGPDQQGRHSARAGSLLIESTWCAIPWAEPGGEGLGSGDSEAQRAAGPLRNRQSGIVERGGPGIPAACGCPPPRASFISPWRLIPTAGRPIREGYRLPREE